MKTAGPVETTWVAESMRAAISDDAMSRPAFGGSSVATAPKIHSMAYRLYLAGVFLMSLQLELAAFKNVADTRFPPGDLFLLLSVLAAPTAVRVWRNPIGLLPVSMILVMAYGVGLALVYAGDVSSNALFVKFGGTFMLATWCLVTIHYARRGQAPLIMRVWITGMVFWGAVSYVDWKYLDLIPGLVAKVESRFGGMQFDPNNAGAGYAVVVLLLWRYGPRLYASPITRGVFLAASCLFLGSTFSRGGLVGCVIGALVVFVVSSDAMSRRGKAVLVVVAIVGVAFLSGYVDDALQSYSVRPDNVTSRDTVIDEAIDELAESRGLGIGLGTHFANNTRIVHNTAVWLTAEMSIVGLAFFFAIAAVPAHATLKGRRTDRDLALALFGAHVAMTIASLGIEAIYQRQWWLIIGLCAAPTLRAGSDDGYRAGSAAGGDASREVSRERRRRR